MLVTVCGRRCCRLEWKSSISSPGLLSLIVIIESGYLYLESDLELTKSVFIVGPGAEQLRIDSGARQIEFPAAGGITASFSDLELAGHVEDPPSGAANTLRLTRVRGASSFVMRVDGCGDACGTLDVVDSTIWGNLGGGQVNVLRTVVREGECPPICLRGSFGGEIQAASGTIVDSVARRLDVFNDTGSDFNSVYIRGSEIRTDQTTYRPAIVVSDGHLTVEDSIVAGLNGIEGLIGSESITIRNSTIEASDQAAVLARARSLPAPQVNVVISQSTLSGGADFGVYGLFSVVDIQQTEISGFERGVQVVGGLQLTQSTVSHNHWGVRLLALQPSSIESSTIHANQYGLSGRADAKITLENSTIAANGIEAISVDNFIPTALRWKSVFRRLWGTPSCRCLEPEPSVSIWGCQFGWRGGPQRLPDLEGE